MKAGMDANGCGAAQQGVNTSDGETWCGGGEWEEREEDGVKEKRSGWRQAQRW